MKNEPCYGHPLYYHLLHTKHHKNTRTIYMAVGTTAQSKSALTIVNKYVLTGANRECREEAVDQDRRFPGPAGSH